MMVAAGWLALTGCSDAMDPIPNPTPDPSTPETGREALSITATLSGSAVQTKAAGSNLAADDVLYAYIRQVKQQGGSSDYTRVDASVESWVKLTVNRASTAVNPTETPNRESTSSFQETVYWDDFSTTEHDLREAALQSYYGYCYNGNTGSFTPNANNGKLTWSVAADQTGGYKTSDLLWSKAQTPVKYEHGTQGDPASHGTLTIPYTHAMSKVTVVVQTDGAFDETALNSTSAALTNVYRTGEMNAPEGTVNPEAASTGTIQMHPIAEATATTFEALMIPGLALTEGLTLAQINNVANNNYKITITPNILASWSTQLAEGKTTKPGVNYKLTLTVRKQSVNIVASLTDWVNVEATGEGIVRFANDVKSIVTDGTQLTDGSVDVFWVKQTTEGATLSTVATKDYVTTSTYNATDGKWTNAPALYWDNGTDCYYFRGLAKKEGGAIMSYKPASGDYSFDVEQGTDLLWATTPKHTGNIEDGTTQNFDEGVAINPRTGNVPLRFDHAMSQISFTLKSSPEGAADRVDLDGATLSLAQVVKKGTIEPANGKITPSAVAGDKVVLTPTTTASSIVVPQELTDGMILTIRLKNDVSTYKIALKNCKLTDGTAVTEWEGGKHYTYTITLKKEAVQLIAFVKNWEKVEVNGDANLDWD